MQEALEAMSETSRSRRSERGFALILAILALMLLTFLGLTLATTTSTELQIASNYRWSQQARYNAEAGIEAAKSMLRTLDWATILPDVRGGGAPTEWDGFTAPVQQGGSAGVAMAKSARADAWGNPTRNFESWECDMRGDGVGYGVILDDAGAPVSPTSGPVQYRTTFLGQNLNGAFTVWIRRPTEVRGQTGMLHDYDDNPDTMVVVSEGIAPFTGGVSGNAFAQSNAAVQVVEAVLSRVVPNTTDPCGTRGGQSGGGSEGAGFSPCDPVTGDGLAPALGAAGTGGRGTLVDTGAQ
jgi:Tfp pilus assembly protein PilX